MYFNFRIILKIVGVISFIMAIAMVPSLIFAYNYGEQDAGIAFFKSIILAVTIGGAIRIFVRPTSSMIKMRDGYLIAAVCWLAASILGAFPYMLSGITPSYIDAFFESVSGFTTTGATIINDFQDIPKAILFWRALSHWLGAMGILILAISLLPALGIGGLMIANAEVPGPTLEKMTTRISDSARMLYTIYIAFTLIEIILLKLGGLSYFDAMTHTFSSISTGGTALYQDGIAHFNSLYVEIVVTFFHIVASVNFVLYHKFFKGKWREFAKDNELRVFMAILFTSTLLITLNLWYSGIYDSFGSSLRNSAFNSVSIMSTTGSSIADYTLWPSFSQMMLLYLMIIGGCSSSTSGALKVARIIIIFKLIVRGMYKRLHPNAVVSVKLGGKTISAETV
ncbi:MAG: potassium transporter TrkG, partial [Eubacteriales bacterium]|nr:potassium transporter TrkG [Eubacteriales bacterium]